MKYWPTEKIDITLYLYTYKVHGQSRGSGVKVREVGIKKCHRTCTDIQKTEDWDKANWRYAYWDVINSKNPFLWNGGSEN